MPSCTSVSIIIPCYNYGKFVGETIQSALNQTVECEIIVVDDCSTDNSAEVISKYPVTYIRNDKNLRVSETRNKGIRQASGEFIVCLDADDRIRPTFVEKLLPLFKTEKDAIAFSAVITMNEYGKFTHHVWFRSIANPELQYRGINQIPSCCMFRKTWWQLAEGFDDEYDSVEDANLWLKIMALGGDIQQTKEILMEYRIHSNSLSRRKQVVWNELIVNKPVRFENEILER